MNKKEEKTPEIIYHYCTIETFFKIINNNSIWLSDISKSNDSKELNWIKERALDFITKNMFEYSQRMKDEDKLSEVPFDKYNEVKELLTLHSQLETEKCWVICLSEKRDDLGQWRGYSQDGTGVCIGFKTSFLQKIVGDNKLSMIDDKQLHFDKVTYLGNNIDKLFDEIDNLPKITKKDEMIDLMQRTMVLSVLLSPFYKSDYFKDEEEWRLAFSMSCDEINDGQIPSVNNDFLSSKYEYSLIRGQLISHLELVFKNLSDGIAEIVLGPKCTLTVREVILFLISKGYMKSVDERSIRVFASDAPYR